MSEAMALESLAESYAKLLGYITETRVPYLNKLDSKGNKKEDLQLGDIDVIGHTTSNKLLVIEAKGWGRVESYSNWCKRDRLIELFNLIDKISHTKEIKIKHWNRLFIRKKKFDEIWIVMSGPFIQKQWLKPFSKSEVKKYFGYNFLNRCIKQFNHVYEANDKRHTEKTYIQIFEKLAKKRFKTTIRIIPIHLLIKKLVLKVCDDMFYRRKRYPDTALESFRWIVKSVGYGSLDLAELEKEIKKKYELNRDYW